VPPQGSHPHGDRELLKGGTQIENIKLLCAAGLHRKNTLEDWYSYLGKETVESSGRTGSSIMMQRRTS